MNVYQSINAACVAIVCAIYIPDVLLLQVVQVSQAMRTEHVNDII